MIATLNKSIESASQRTSALNGPEGLRLFTADEYQRLADVGILGEDDRVELIEGRIVRMAAKNIKHAMATKRANRYFTRLLGDRVVVGVQDPILLNDYSEPEPDIILVAPPEDRYFDHHPTPKEIYLVLEVADSSLPYDRDVKCPLFAYNKIIQFCLLNLQNRELEDYRQPSRNGYRSKQTYSEDEVFNLVAFPEVSIEVKDLLPPVKATVKRRKK
ncbi:MAG TPA: Uma2 family endonuclease [Blastocatellia bacterium]|nr:Uma2 family endonuclease [Blastocatellia bacterium]